LAPVSVPVPLLRVSALRVATDFLERDGAPVERLLEKVKLSRQLVEQPESLVPFLAVARFVEEAARATGMEDFGLRMGTVVLPMPPGPSVGLRGKAARCTGCWRSRTGSGLSTTRACRRGSLAAGTWRCCTIVSAMAASGSYTTTPPSS
jgi:hypothetical protein